MSRILFRPDAILDATQVEVIPRGTPVDWNGPRVLLANGQLAQPPRPPDPLVAWLTLATWVLAIIVVAVLAFTMWEAVTERRRRRP